MERTRQSKLSQYPSKTATACSVGSDHLFKPRTMPGLNDFYFHLISALTYPKSPSYREDIQLSKCQLTYIGRYHSGRLRACERW